MNEPAAAATYGDAIAFVWSLLLVQARVIPLFITLPFMNRSLVPNMMRYAFAVGIGLVATPVLMPALQASGLPQGLPLLALLLKEAFIGFVLGWLVAIPFWAFEAVGFIIDNQRGASIAATIDPMTGHDSSPLGLMFEQAFIVFFFIAGGIHLLLGVVYDSYAQWHPLHFWPTLDAASGELLVAQLSRMVMIGLLLASPVLVAMFLAEMGLALVSRFVPQLQVFFLAMPIKSGLAMLLLMLYAATLFDYGREHLREIGTWVQRLDPLWTGK